MAFTFAIRSKRNVSMRGFYASGILTRRGFAAWKSWTNIFRNSVPSFRCWTLHAFVPTLEQFRDLVYTLHETKERRCCVFSDRWFESWRWLWPWRIFDERKSFVSGQISTHLDISIEILSKGIERIIMFHRVKKRERFRGILNRESISFRPGKKGTWTRRACKTYG